jgi:hypothetical protein
MIWAFAKYELPGALALGWQANQESALAKHELPGTL